MSTRPSRCLRSRPKSSAREIRIIDRAWRLIPILTPLSVREGVMTNIYAPIMRALVAVALIVATATLMFVAVSTVRAGTALAPVII